MVQTFNQLLAQDLKEKLEKHETTPFQLAKSGVISDVSIRNIIKVKNTNSFPFSLAIRVYKELGYNEIKLANDKGQKLFVKW
jgi:LEA14-like dessication related protein